MNSKLLEVFYKLKVFNRKIKNNKLRFVKYNKVYKNNFFYMYQLQKSKVLENNPYKDIIYNYLMKAEANYPGCSYFVIEKLLSKLNVNNLNNNKVKTESNLENLRAYITSVSSNKEYADLFLNILNFSGPDATIICKPTENSETSIIKKNNTYFKIDLHESFRGVYFSNQVETTKNFIISVMDAYVEKESEIMSLVNYSAEQKTPVVLVCRGISDSAILSLKNIILRNKIYIYPYIAKFNNEDPFLLKDLSEALGSQLFSLETGDNLYTGLVEKTTSKKLKLKSNLIEIFDIEKSLVKSINEQLKNADFELKKYLLKRKNRLLPNIVEIHVPKDKIDFISEINNLIRCYNHCIRYGFLKDEKEKVYSIKENTVSDKLSEKLFNTLSNIGCVIMEKKNE